MCCPTLEVLAEGRAVYDDMSAVAYSQQNACAEMVTALSTCTPIGMGRSLVLPEALHSLRSIQRN